MKHTKGPWVVTTAEELTITGERRPASYIHSSQGWANSGMAGRRTIAIVGHWKDRPNPEADAELIAKAPEMYDQLASARAIMQKFVDKVDRGMARSTETYAEMTEWLEEN